MSDDGNLLVFEVKITCLMSNDGDLDLKVTQEGEAPAFQIIGALETAKYMMMEMARGDG